MKKPVRTGLTALAVALVSLTATAGAGEAVDPLAPTGPTGPKTADALSPRAFAPPARPLVLVDHEEVEIETRDRLTLKGSWFEPRSKSQPKPGVLLVHDAGSDRASLKGIALRLQKDGLAVLTIDLRGHGGSATDELDWSGLDEAEKKAQWAFAQRDVDAAVRWLLGRDEVHSTRLSLVGHGAGCALAVRHIRDDENGVAIALVEPRPESYGFEVNKDLVDLEGLPTYVVAPRGGDGQLTTAMVDEANAVTGGDPFVELWMTRPPLLEDRRTAVKISNFLEAHALPKKGR